MTDNNTQEQSEGESLRIIFNSFFKELNTSMPGIIESYDKDKQTASIIPVFQRAEFPEGEKVTFDLPVIENVPVFFPRSGNFYLHFPVKKGDLVYLIFSQRSIDNYLATDGKETIDPDSFQMHSINDCFALHGFSTQINKVNIPNNDDVFLGLEDDSFRLQITANGDVKIKAERLNLGSLTATKALALAEKCNSNFNSIKTFVNAHVHTGNLGAPTPLVGSIGSLDDVDSGKVFTDG